MRGVVTNRIVIVLRGLGALACLLLPSLALADHTYVVRQSAAPCLRLRPQPDDDIPHVDCIAVGTHVTEEESVPFWRKVTLSDGRTGWVAKKFLEPTPHEPPVDQPPATIPSNAFLEVHFVDVGQGDGIWIHTFDDGIQGNGIFEGRNIVIDGGPNSADHSNEMLKYLRNFAHHNAIIDTLIVSHPHDDHYPGAEGLIRHFEVAKYYDPGFPKTGVAYPAFKAAVQQEKFNGQPSKVMFGKANFAPFDWGSEVKAEVLYSYPGSNTGLGSATNTIENNASIVVRMEYGNHVFIFMGDAEGKERDDDPRDPPKYAEKILLDTLPAAKLKASVLKIGHHGSETSGTKNFIDTVDPEILVVSSGRKDFSGTFLPRPSTLKRYCCHDSATRIYRTDQNDEADGLTASTDQDGDHIVIRTNGTDIEVNALSAGQPLTVSSCEPGCS